MNSKTTKTVTVLIIVLCINGVVSVFDSSEEVADGPKNDIVLPNDDHDLHQPLSLCKPTTTNTDKLKYEFFPISTKIGFAFVGVWLGFILIAKIMYTSSDQYRTTNKYDLVLFKPPSKTAGSSAIGPRRIYSNNTANIQNINAAAASGIDFSVLNVKCPLPNQSQGQHQNDAATLSSSSQTNIGKL